MYECFQALSTGYSYLKPGPNLGTFVIVPTIPTKTQEKDAERQGIFVFLAARTDCAGKPKHGGGLDAAAHFGCSWHKIIRVLRNRVKEFIDKRRRKKCILLTLFVQQ